MALSSSLKNIAKSVGSTTKSLVSNSTGAYRSVKSNTGRSSGSSILGSLLSSSGSRTNTSRTSGSSSGSSLLGSLLSSSGSRTNTSRTSGSSSSGILSSLVSGISSRSASTGTNKYITTRSSSQSGGTILSSLFSSFGNTKSKTNVSNAISSLLSSTKARTGGSSIISSIFNRNTGTTSGSSGTGVSKISNLNVFSGLKNLISGAKSNITGGDGTTKVNTIGLLGLSTTLGSASQRIQESFNNWKSKLGLLPMSGIATNSASSAAGQMTSLFSRFSEFSNNLSNRILGRAESAKATDQVGITENLGISGGSVPENARKGSSKIISLSAFYPEEVGGENYHLAALCGVGGNPNGPTVGYRNSSGQFVPNTAAGFSVNNDGAIQYYGYNVLGTTNRQKYPQNSVIEYTTGGKTVVGVVLDNNGDNPGRFAHTDIDNLVVKESYNSFENGKDFRNGEAHPSAEARIVGTMDPKTGQVTWNS